MIKTKLLYILLFFSLVSFIGSQPKIVTWEDLSQVGYRRSFSPEFQDWYDKPIFAKPILKLKNQTIQITGYVIPMDTYGDRYFLSAMPNSSCFFCGAAEKHTIMEIKLKNLPANYKMDEYLTFEGVLNTHTKSIDLPYSLENATLVKDEN